MRRPTGRNMFRPVGPIMIGPGHIGALARQLAYLIRLPPRVTMFYLRCLLVALQTRDRWSLHVVTRPRELVALLEAAGHRATVIEDGTASAWTTAALALAEPERRVITFDPFPHPERERYLRLLGSSTRSRIRLVKARTEEGPAALGWASEVVEFVFLDGDHSRTGVIAALEAWRPMLAPGAVVAFHDYGDPAYPGVAEAVGALGLDGEVRGRLFVARTPH